MIIHTKYALKPSGQMLVSLLLQLMTDGIIYVYTGVTILTSIHLIVFPFKAHIS